MNDREPLAHRRQLGLGLRRGMTTAGFDSKRLAAELGWAHSRVCRLLSGTRTARKADVAQFLEVCGVHGTPQERLLALCREDTTPDLLAELLTRLYTQPAG